MTAKRAGQTEKERVMTQRYAMTTRLPAPVPASRCTMGRSIGRSIGCSIGCIRRKSAFTLIEVMVALLVITLGMGAVIVTTGESGWKSSHLRESTIASWVAYNEIAMYRAKRTWSDASSRSGDAEMANTEWDWQMKISKTDDPSLRRLDVEVSIKGETAVKARVTGFIARL
jgi:general secretion pathway protein I